MYQENIKFCKRCGISKNIIYFAKNKLTKDGLRVCCKECDKELLRSATTVLRNTNPEWQEFNKEYLTNAKHYIIFNPSWNNGTGYMDGLIKDEKVKVLNDGVYVSWDTVSDRRMVITVLSNNVTVRFERYTNGASGTICSNK